MAKLEQETGHAGIRPQTIQAKAGMRISCPKPLCLRLSMISILLVLLYPMPTDTLAAAQTDTYSGEQTPTAGMGLDQNHPNPFSASTIIGYTLPASQNMELTIYDIHGRQIRTLVDGCGSAGYAQAVWDARDNAGNRVSPGIYMVRLEVQGLVNSRKITLLPVSY